MRTRAVAARTTIAAVLATVALSAGPVAGATEYTDVDTRNEWRNALAAASADDSGPHTITITGNFRVQAGDNTAYTGTQPLTIEGGGFVVRGTDADEPSGNLFLSVPNTSTPLVTIRNLTIREFVTEGAIRTVNGALTVESVTFVANAAPEASIPDGIPTASAITSSGGLTIDDSVFRNNTGGIGAVNDLVNFSSPGLETSGDTAPSEISNTTFRENSGDAAGGAAFADEVLIEDSLFVDNISHVYGGAALALIAEGGEIDDTIFRRNLAVDASDSSILVGEGGAIAAAGELLITDSKFEENAAERGGAVAFNPTGDPSSEGELIVRRTRLDNNSASQEGGAIYATAPVEIDDSVLAENVAGYGGAIYAYALVVENSLLRKNEGGLGSGAIEASTIDGGDIAIRNSTIAGSQSSGHDAAVTIEVSDEEHVATVEFTTFINNRGQAPQAIEVEVAANAGFYLVGNAIRAENRDACSFDFEEPTTGILIAYNFDSDGTCTDGAYGPGNFGEGVDPKIDGLSLNDGDTRTAALLPGSPLIDVIPEEYCMVAADQRGVDRPVGSACDVGSFEYEPFTYVVPFTIAMTEGEITGVAAPAVDVGEIDWTATLPGTPPAGVTFPYGLSTFAIQTASVGDTVTITLTFPTPINQLWKESDGTWTKIDALFSGNTATYEITDGGALDEDGVADGFIFDPVAAGVGASFTG